MIVAPLIPSKLAKGGYIALLSQGRSMRCRSMQLKVVLSHEVVDPCPSFHAEVP